MSVKKPSVQPMRRNCCLIGTSLSSWPGLGRRMMIDDAGDGDGDGDDDDEEEEDDDAVGDSESEFQITAVRMVLITCDS